jgi:transposase InsO family protein
MGEFETACHVKGIARSVLPPRSPKLNGRVGRLNGTARREFWGHDDGDVDLPTLPQAPRAWEEAYNTRRLHQALGYAAPSAHLTTVDSYMS